MLLNESCVASSPHLLEFSIGETCFSRGCMIDFLISLNFSMQVQPSLKLINKIYSHPMFDQVYLTGFKKFGNHEVNPTQLISQHFGKAAIPGLECDVVEVTVEAADAYIEKIKHKIAELPGKRILNVHFGVGPNKVYHLQTRGYNNKNFRIPDNNGNVFSKVKICENESLDFPINCKLDFSEITNALGQDFEMIESNDPGRYLCNYIYFKSLHDLCKDEQVCSVFIHIPVHSVTPHEKNIEFVKGLIGLLLKKQ